MHCCSVNNGFLICKSLSGAYKFLVQVLFVYCVLVVKMVEQLTCYHCCCFSVAGEIIKIFNFKSRQFYLV